MKCFTISILVFIIFLPSCSTISTIKLLKSGEIEQDEYFVEIPFENRLGLIILKVDISGEEYDFLLDTGAPNVISIELAEKLNLSYEFEQKVEDSQDVDSDLGFATIERIDIGGIHFLNTGAAIADLKKTKEIACLKIDGLIGSNLMRKAIWKFDYQNQTVTISNSIESFEIPTSSAKVPFFTGLTGTPSVDVELGNVNEKNVILDLGSNGGFSMSKNSFETIVKEDFSVPRSYKYGNSSLGLYGRGEVDSTHYIKVPSISLGDILLVNNIVSFTNDSRSTIGNLFFENYDLIINWFSKEVVLINHTEYSNSFLSNFGFLYSNESNQLVVSAVFENMKDLKLGDQILNIDGKDYRELSDDEWCRIVEDGLIAEGSEKINMSILRENREIKYTLIKTERL